MLKMYHAVAAAAMLCVLASAAAARPTVISPNGKLEASADGATITLTDVATKKVLVAIRAHRGDVTALEFTPDGMMLVSAGQDGMGSLFHVATGKQLLSFNLGFTAVSIQADAANASFMDAAKKKRTFELATGREVKK